MKEEIKYYLWLVVTIPTEIIFILIVVPPLYIKYGNDPGKRTNEVWKFVNIIRSMPYIDTWSFAISVFIWTLPVWWYVSIKLFTILFIIKCLLSLFIWGWIVGNCRAIYDTFLRKLPVIYPDLIAPGSQGVPTPKPYYVTLSQEEKIIHRYYRIKGFLGETLRVLILLTVNIILQYSIIFDFIKLFQ